MSALILIATPSSATTLSNPTAHAPPEAHPIAAVPKADPSFNGAESKATPASKKRPHVTPASHHHPIQNRAEPTPDAVVPAQPSPNTAVPKADPGPKSRPHVDPKQHHHPIHNSDPDYPRPAHHSDTPSKQSRTPGFKRETGSGVRRGAELQKMAKMAGFKRAPLQLDVRRDALVAIDAPGRRAALFGKRRIEYE